MMLVFEFLKGVRGPSSTVPTADLRVSLKVTESVGLKKQLRVCPSTLRTAKPSVERLKAFI